MGVYEDLLAWSLDRPLWQRDALRRLTDSPVGNGEIRELADIAIAAARGEAAGAAVPLDEGHLPTAAAGTRIQLLALSHVENVNAIAPGSEIAFGRDGLTAVYGDNASGKSGYVRVLKKLCRARAAGGPIHPNVFGPVPAPPSARIQYLANDVPEEAAWSVETEPPLALAQVSVYDRECASVYVTGENEVAYRPFGLDLLDQLADTADRVRQEIDRRRRDHGRQLVDVPAEVQTNPDFGARFPLTATSDAESVLAGAAWSADDQAEMTGVEQALATESPARRAGSLAAVRSSRSRLLGVAGAMATAVSDEAISRLRDVRQAQAEAAAAMHSLHDDAFGQSEGLGGEHWRRLWQAARRWSEEEVYPGQEFPYVGSGAVCVLCGQELSEPAANRFVRFREFVISEIATQLETAAAAAAAAATPLDEIGANTELDALVVDMAHDRPDLAAVTETFLASCRARASAALQASSVEQWDAVPNLEPSPAQALSQDVAALDREIDLLRAASSPENIQPLRDRRSTLLARRWVAQNTDAVRREIARLKEMAVLNEAAATCTTNAITTESTRLTDRYVTQELAESFEAELEALRATRLPLQVTRRGQRGAAYHRIELRDPTVAGVRAQDILSEGEFSAVALAAFLAETIHGGEASAVVLDDPVSSFDHMHRRSAARRLAEEASRRQVVVFTHDLVFLSNMEATAEEMGVPVTVLNLRVRAEGVGVPEDGPPWTAQRVPARIGRMQDELSLARASFEAGAMDQYESRARNWYGDLRETWERAVEEILFGEVVVRYRHGVETRRATREKIWLVEEEDIHVLESAMTKVSGQIRGHDQPGAVNDPVPPPAELADDLNVLRTWVDSLRARRRP